MPALSTRAHHKKTQNRRQVAWTLSIFAILVLAMTWYDLNVRDYSYVHRAPSEAHYIKTEADLANLPDDYSIVTIWQGTLDSAPDGKVNVHHEGPNPLSLPQRQVNLLIGVPHLPSAAVESGLMEAIEATIHTWEKDNNMVAEIILDIRHMDAPPRALLGFIQRLREKLEMGYRVALLVDPVKGPVSTDDANARSDLLNALGILYFYLPPKEADAAFVKAEDFAFPYHVIVDSDMDAPTAPDDAHGKYKYFQGFLHAPSQLQGKPE